ncbi:alpha/beta hydrolase [Cognatishimia sp. 1_MG-2023]|uniref:alpha/beta hydrolase n=1 Tax=Cognatishimia sp. 1_MG-2023 TaxID=3062642 RepID=UPI0026E337D5|nr:alpha/beta hydrolase [Cognatishimia sp. 1_MG-2023]MDO6726309.1 alpha/beta hydrolase [Cognatishimia sp. 1_MG-2023]
MTLERAPYFADIPGEKEATAYWLTASDGVRLRAAVWPCDAAKGTVLLFPGRTEYVEKYALNATELAAAGYATISIDWRGQGLADRLVPHKMAGHVDRFDDYQKDVASLMDAAEALDLPKPYFMVGHSMGGCIGLRALVEGLSVKAAAFTGPMWGIGLSPLLRPVAYVVGGIGVAIGGGHWLAPGTSYDTYVLDCAFEDNMLTKDRDMYARLQTQARAHPEVTLGGPTLRWVTQALYECRDLAKRPAPSMPCITFLGTDEKIISASAIQKRMDNWPNGDLRMVPAGEHEVLMEGDTTRGQVTADMVALFEDNL